MKALAALLGLAGGLGLFIYGMQICSGGLQKMAANRLKRLVKSLTRNPLVGLLVGIATTLGLQSSTATSTLVVGFVSAGLMSLSQALSILLGSALGASLTIQLIAFRITELSLVLLCIGSFLYLFGKRLRHKNLGQTILGFGLIFYGMFMMSSAMAPLRDYPLVAETLIRLGHYPFLEFMVAMVATALIQSSPAFLAMLISLASHQLISSAAIIPFVLGAHLGGTVTAVLSSLGAPGRDAKRAALANFGFKLLNGLVFLPFYQPIAQLILWSSADPGRQIANAHAFFSLVMALVFLPLTSQTAKLFERLIPNISVGLGEAKFLDETLLEVPEQAMDQAFCQTIELGKIIREEMLSRVAPMLHGENEELNEKLIQAEQAVDLMYKKINEYLNRLGEGGLSEELVGKSMSILYVVSDLEHIGDILMRVVQTSQKISQQELQFSDEGFDELTSIVQWVSNNFNLALKAFETVDHNLATRVMKEHPKILRSEKELRYNHFDRMQSGNQKTIASSAAHLDLVEAMLRIDSHSVGIAQTVAGIV